MIVVMDASAAIEIALNREYAAQFREIVRKSDLVAAPDTFPSEIANAFWKYCVRSELSMETCEKGMEYCLDLVDDYIKSAVLYKEAFAEAVKNRHPVYDLLYLVLARRNNGFIVTRDEKLKRIAQKMNIVCLK